MAINLYNDDAVLGCWSSDSQLRPTFKMILTELKTIAESNFIEVPDDSFKTMQDDWREEIQAMFEDLRAKEKVRFFCRFSAIPQKGKCYLAPG